MIMYNSPMKQFYTGKGDDGTTGLLGPGRVPKHHPRLQALGAVDEAQAALGAARAQLQDPELDGIIQAIQRDLYRIMSTLAAEEDQADRFPGVPEERLSWLEDRVNQYGEQIELPGEFILPGGSPAAAAFSVARTVVRRAERWTAELVDRGLVTSQTTLPYLNRLSSLCFVLEIYTLDEPPLKAAEDS